MPHPERLSLGQKAEAGGAGLPARARRGRRPPGSQRILVIHRSALARDMLEVLIRARAPELEVRTAASLHDASPDTGAPIQLALLHVNSVIDGDPGINSLISDVQGALGSQCRVLILADRDSAATESWSAIHRGASGYFASNLPGDLLIAAIRLIVAGGVFLSPEALRSLVHPNVIQGMGAG